MSKKRQAKQRMVILLSMLLMITVGSVVFGSIFSNAHGNSSEEPALCKYYKSIVIQEGDTLWDIAKEYKSDSCENIQEYIDEIKQINSLDSDTIHEDQHILITYYDYDFQK